MYIRPILSVFSSPLPISVRFTLPRRFPAYRSFYLDNPTYRRGGEGGEGFVSWLDRVSSLSFLPSSRIDRVEIHPIPSLHGPDFLDNASDFDLYDATDSYTESPKGAPRRKL